MFSVVPVEAQTFATGQKLEDALLTPPADLVAMVCHGHLGPKHSGKEHLKTSCQALAQFQLLGLPMEQFLQHLNVITISQDITRLFILQAGEVVLDIAAQNSNIQSI